MIFLDRITKCEVFRLLIVKVAEVKGHPRLFNVIRFHHHYFFNIHNNYNMQNNPILGKSTDYINYKICGFHNNTFFRLNILNVLKWGQNVKSLLEFCKSCTIYKYDMYWYK